MGLWEAMRGRRQPKRNDLDALFHVPSAAITLQTALGFAPTGTGSVCYRSAAGAAFAQTQQDVLALLRDDAEAPDVAVTEDDFGFTWLVVEGDPADTAGLCTDLHAVNTTLELNGFASGLLCSMVPFVGAAGQRFGLTYLYKQGTFYPFAPKGGQTRDTLLELSVRDLLGEELPMEPDLQRWLAVWKAPGL
ncbi:hypothetical protein GCM10023339_77570 [Alloalcanivorax gelatiniphagus]